jgi:mevalonate kinase
VAGETIVEALRRIGARAAGKISGAGTGTETIMDWAASENTIVYTVDANGNISGVVFN